MKLDALLGVGPHTLADIATTAREAESHGFSALWSSETSHDPFLPHMTAAEHTSTIDLGTGVAVGFARNPMVLAYTAYDLNVFSGGRFILGLGPQIKPHIERRFSMPWSRPAARMREMVAAIQHIWRSWTEGSKLDFRGDFYQHTLSAPFFNPGPSPAGLPQIYLAAVGPRMTEVTGEVADGYLSHGFNTPRYLREHTLPAIERGLLAAGRTRDQIQVGGSAFVVVDNGDAATRAATAALRQQLSFYASTPSYRPVLEAHGWAAAQDELHALTKAGKWDQMAAVLDDTMLNEFAVIATPDRVADELVHRYGALVDRINLFTYGEVDADFQASLLARLSTNTASSTGP